ncbi:MAG TPA: DUF177 domain-containing protein [Actinomycetota bacterium]|nr:DUF177 domain-containing protein [Actinomycetota bacterium]
MSTVIDVRDLVEQPGASRRVRVHEGIPGLATQLAAVPEDRPVGADLLFESVVEGILVTGPVSGQMALTCARCLASFERGFRVEVQELFVPGASGEEDEYPLVEGFVDLEPMIRDAVILAMPFAPLCRPDCLGLCERCGGNRNLGECACPPPTDPRWAPLAGLRLEDEPRGP